MTNEDIESRKIESEIARNEAERKKLNLDANKWFISLKYLIAGIVAAALITAWGIGYLKPILKKNNELSDIENRILAAENIEQKNRIEEHQKELEEREKLYQEDLKSLDSINSAIKIQQKESAKLVSNLQDRLNKVSREYNRLAQKQQTNESERIRYAKLANETKEEALALKFNLNNVRATQQKTEKRTIEISEKLLSSNLINSCWKVVKFEDGVSMETAYIVLLPNGNLMQSRAPNKPSSGKHNWRVEGSKLIFELNDKFVTYKAKITGPDPQSIKGVANNKRKSKWNWKATRIEEETFWKKWYKSKK